MTVLPDWWAVVQSPAGGACQVLIQEHDQTGQIASSVRSPVVLSHAQGCKEAGEVVQLEHYEVKQGKCKALPRGGITLCTSGGSEQPAGKQLCWQVLVASKVTMTQLHLMAAEGTSLILGCMSRRATNPFPSAPCAPCCISSPAAHELVCIPKHIAYLHHPADATLCVAISFRFQQVQLLLGLQYSSTHPSG